ncbi:unnamed protein product, partial [Cladocopium goreaui]
MIGIAMAQVVVLLILLVWWLEIPRCQQSEYQVVEFYSGVGRIAELAAKVGFVAAAVDKDYGMDYAKKNTKRSPMDINSNAGLILAIHILLFGEWEQICAFYAIVCSSWVPVNRGSTGRSIMTPLGCEDYPNVRASNKMTSRTVILIWITVLMGGTYFMENPQNSLVALHPRYIWMLGQLRKIDVFTYKIAFWMRKYSSLSWKRTWVWSSTPLIRALDLGPLTEQERFTSRPTTTRYKDAKGKTRFKGNTNLKRSQQYTYKFAGKLIRLVGEVRKQKVHLPIEVSSDSIFNLFEKMKWDQQSIAWEQEADLRKVLQYARGSKLLRLWMVRHLESRVFSSETLVAGVGMVEMGAGLPSPPSDTFELMQELASLEAMKAQMEAEVKA